jgi:hypothetical protein
LRGKEKRRFERDSGNRGGLPDAQPFVMKDDGIMQLGLVDRLRLLVFPLILGSGGREPIYAGYPQVRLELIDTKVLDSRLIVLEYRPVRRTPS